MVRALVEAFPDHAIMLTDGLINSVYLSPAVESILGERADALVNRLGFSLLGFGERDRLAPGLLEALSGSGEPWEGIVQLQSAAGPRTAFVQASAIRSRAGSLLAGVVRIGKVQGK
jgi:PAS domain-containing protein